MNRHHSSTKAMPRPGGFPLPLSAFCTCSSKIQEDNSSSALPALAAFAWGLIQRGHLSSGQKLQRLHVTKQLFHLAWTFVSVETRTPSPIPSSMQLQHGRKSTGLASLAAKGLAPWNSGKAWQQVWQLQTIPAGEHGEWSCSGSTLFHCGDSNLKG